MPRLELKRCQRTKSKKQINDHKAREKAGTYATIAVKLLSEPNARSRACGHFFMRELPTDGKPIKLNGAFHMLCVILQFAVASTAKAELGALFLICQEGFKLTLEDLGHNQKYRYIATMQPLLASQITPSNGREHKQ